MLYQYDQLGRLISAATEGAGGWGLAWVFDGYGNLRQQNVTKGSLTGFSFSINASTNRINGQTYDANGNWTAQWPMHQTYDIENRISAVIGNQSQQNESYLYSGRNERMVVTRGTENGIKRLHFYGADGLLLGVYRLEIAEQTVYSFPVRLPDQERVYFGGRLMQIGGEWVATDRLGSVVRKGTTNYKYAPYGQEIGGATANDTNKFATYTRDSLSGLDYALNRYYKPEWGRFTSPDPYQASGGPADPGSWNRYTYVGGDPVNYADPTGHDRIRTDWLLGGQLACLVWQNRESDTYLACVAGSVSARRESSYTNLLERSDFDVPLWKMRHIELNHRYSQRVRTTVSNMGVDCQNAVASLTDRTGKSLSADSLSTSAVYWDTRLPEVSSIKVSSILQNVNHPEARLGDWWAIRAPGQHAHAAVLDSTTGAVSNHVVLYSLFHDASNPLQNIILVHEALHAATGLNDLALALALGINYSQSMRPSQAITSFLENGCDKTKIY